MPKINFQSVVFVALFSSFTLDLAGDMGTAAALAIGTGIWMPPIVPADWMRRIGHRGPFESTGMQSKADTRQRRSPAPRRRRGRSDGRCRRARRLVSERL
ncbi:DUF418 domain-containing protein [Nonomuraea typhae]|uniref:DUF418 domain-containing protein n=1 Tax=Nonomuraea typhae TaxID=2603600 RepID=UPI0012FAC737|nr:DUF418 domain-containing protein [Nonomuraea typhae]